MKKISIFLFILMIFCTSFLLSQQIEIHEQLKQSVNRCDSECRTIQSSPFMCDAVRRNLMTGHRKCTAASQSNNKDAGMPALREVLYMMDQYCPAESIVFKKMVGLIK